MVQIYGYNEDVLVDKTVLSSYEYYDEENPLIDNEEYRRANKINRVVGKMYRTDIDVKPEAADDDTLSELFVIHYDANGRLTGSDDYNSDMLLTEITMTRYEYSEYIGFFDVFFSIKEEQIDCTVFLKPLTKGKKYVTYLYLRSPDAEAAEPIYQKRIQMEADNYFKIVTGFEVVPGTRYLTELCVEVYDGDTLLGKNTDTLGIINDKAPSFAVKSGD